MQQYGVDLTSAELHWWAFKGMFDALSRDTLFGKIKEWRAVKITSKMSKEERNFYAEAKKIYALPSPRMNSKRLDALADALMNGGDVSGLIPQQKI